MSHNHTKRPCASSVLYNSPMVVAKFGMVVSQRFVKASPSNRFDPGSGGSSARSFFGSAGEFWRPYAHSLFLGVIQPASKNNGILGRMIEFSYALSTAFIASFKQSSLFFQGKGEESTSIVAVLSFIPTLSMEVTAKSLCSGGGISHYSLKLRPCHLATSFSTN